LETNLFYQGIRPAISVGLSVSRVGGAAQTMAMKSVGGGLKLDLAQFRELASFAQFSTDLDTETRNIIERGQRLTELLKQPQYTPLAIWQMYASLLAATSGGFDKVPLEKIKAVEAVLFHELEDQHGKLIGDLNGGGQPTDEQKATLLKVVESVAAGYSETSKRSALLEDAVIGQ
jgi:F-type H+-transporting ATPase subunit alpha